MIKHLAFSGCRCILILVSCLDSGRRKLLFEVVYNFVGQFLSAYIIRARLRSLKGVGGGMSWRQNRRHHVAQSHLLGAVAKCDVRTQSFLSREACLALRAHSLLLLLKHGLSAVRALVVDHITQFRCLDVAEQALEELVSPPSRLVDHVLLREAHVAGVMSIPVAHSLLDDLLEWGLQCGRSPLGCDFQIIF